MADSVQPTLCGVDVSLDTLDVAQSDGQCLTLINTPEAITKWLEALPDQVSFAIEATLLGALVVAVDPSYRYGLEALRDQYRCSMDFQSNARGAERFFVDFRAGIAAGRYRASEVHALPFAQRSFDCVFCHKEALENLSGRERSKLVDELGLIGQGTVLLPKAFPGRAAL